MNEPEIIGRKEALARGLKRFFTGRPCVHGHVSERVISSGDCMECCRLRQETTRRKNGVPPKCEAMRDEERRERRARKARERYVPRERKPPRMMEEARRIAMESGKPRYFTGRPCIRGHISERSTFHVHCVECSRLRARERYLKDGPRGRATKAETRRIWAIKNPEKVKRAMRKYYENNKEKVFARVRKPRIALQLLEQLAENDPYLKQLIGEIDDAIR